LSGGSIVRRSRPRFDRQGAGGVGKEFAVIVAEFKNLANQISNATGYTARMIDSIHESKWQTADTVRHNGGTSERINGIQTAITEDFLKRCT
jgi:methyl-accepting chemotaxis protein